MTGIRLTCWVAGLFTLFSSACFEPRDLVIDDLGVEDTGTGRPGDPPEGIPIHPLSEITKDRVLGLPEVNWDKGTASLDFETNKSVICTVVYGFAPAFGTILSSQIGGGTPQTSHQFGFYGLQPNTTYRYRVQAMDGEGIIYASANDLTFSTFPPQR
jgi:hypothetical protein